MVEEGPAVFSAWFGMYFRPVWVFKGRKTRALLTSHPAPHPRGEGGMLVRNGGNIMRDNTFTKTWSFSSQQTPPSGTTVVSLCPDVPGGERDWTEGTRTIWWWWWRSCCIKRSRWVFLKATAKLVCMPLSIRGYFGRSSVNISTGKEEKLCLGGTQRASSALFSPSVE